MGKDYYGILGVGKGATSDDIRKGDYKKCFSSDISDLAYLMFPWN